MKNPGSPVLAIEDPGKALGSPHSELFGDLRATQPGLRGAVLESSDFFTGLLERHSRRHGYPRSWDARDPRGRRQSRGGGHPGRNKARRSPVGKAAVEFDLMVLASPDPREASRLGENRRLFEVRKLVVERLDVRVSCAALSQRSAAGDTEATLSWAEAWMARVSRSLGPRPSM